MAEKTSILVEPGKPTIVITRIFDAPRRLVFEAWTRPEHLARWCGPRYLTLSVCEIDFRPGGAWRFVLRAPDGNDYGFGGEYREILPPERLVYTFRFDGAPGAGGRDADFRRERRQDDAHQHDAPHLGREPRRARPVGDGGRGAPDDGPSRRAPRNDVMSRQ